MTRYLEQAARAERLARSILDKSAFDALMSYARECREKAVRPADLSTSPIDPGAMSGSDLTGSRGATGIDA
jgi:hypothetical protein